ncbi:MAG: hypothetical protein HYT30_00320 [Parcubacteria group bacterium]|nr:hypothetical protein [Parcubacteria group bacterium]
MKRHMGPYVGVTGIMTPQEMRAVCRDFKRLRREDSPHRLMAGVLLSPKTWRGNKNRYPNRYPLAARIAEIFQDDPAVINLIHYNCDADEMPSIGFQLSTITKEIAGPFLHGFQLNMAWPPVEPLRDFHAVTSGKMHIVLQLNTKAMAELNDNPAAIAHRVATYGDTIDAVLIDKSGGTGKLIEVKSSLELLRVLRKKVPHITLAVAGKLTDQTLHTIQPLLDEFPLLSWDTESGVRTKDHDDLDLGLVFDYLDASTAMVAASMQVPEETS